MEPPQLLMGVSSLTLAPADVLLPRLYAAREAYFDSDLLFSLNDEKES